MLKNDTSLILEKLSFFYILTSQKLRRTLSDVILDLENTG